MSAIIKPTTGIWTPHSDRGKKIANFLNWRWYLQKMGMLAGGFYSQGGGGGGYTLDLGTGAPREIFAEVNPDSGDSVIRIYGTFGTRDGQVWATNAAGTIVQFSASTNWIIPNGDSSAEDWQARYTSLTGDTAQLSGSGVNTWVDLDLDDAEIRLAEPVGTGLQYSVAGTAQIRIGTGPVEVSSLIFLATETSEATKGGK